ncbi:hypothetical protein IMCC1989_662 [gamma proteobacterium IMCC1989]|nr:hypothetical protein IMCC1989_662 [gamma proteobacterium IMCC1989]
MQIAPIPSGFQNVHHYKQKIIRDCNNDSHFEQLRNELALQLATYLLALTE